MRFYPGTFLSRIMPNRTADTRRQHRRFDCFSFATLKFLNSSKVLDGAVTNISQSGLNFRPAKSYILDLRGVPVICVFSSLRLPGKIVATRSSGYGVVFLNPLEEDAVVQFAQSFHEEFEDAKSLRART